jgi:hypothetical protein
MAGEKIEISGAIQRWTNDITRGMAFFDNDAKVHKARPLLHKLASASVRVVAALLPHPFGKPVERDQIFHDLSSAQRTWSLFVKQQKTLLRFLLAVLFNKMPHTHFEMVSFLNIHRFPQAGFDEAEVP